MLLLLLLLQYVTPLSALPLLSIRLASIDSPISECPSVRSAITAALEEAAAAAVPAGGGPAAAAAPAAATAAAAETALAAATHRLRIVCVKGQALADLQLSAPLDPRPYRYLPYLPAAAAAGAAAPPPAGAAAAGGAAAAAGGAAAEELRLAAFVAELQRTARRHAAAGPDPSWSLTSVTAGGDSTRGLGGPPRDSDERPPHPQQRRQRVPTDSPDSSSSNNSSSGSSNSSSSSSTNMASLDGLLKGPLKGHWGPLAESSGASRPWGLVPRSAATVSMLRLLYLKGGGASEALAGAAAADSAAAAAAGEDDAAAAVATRNAAAALGLLGADYEEGDVALAAAVAAAGLRRVFKRDKRLVVGTPSYIQTQQLQQLQQQQLLQLL